MLGGGGCERVSMGVGLAEGWLKMVKEEKAVVPHGESMEWR